MMIGNLILPFTGLYYNYAVVARGKNYEKNFYYRYQCTVA